MKKLVLLLCFFLIFVSCGKDKTIEKIIYGDISSYDYDRPAILDKADFDKVPVSKSFNSTDEFINYLKQCKDNKTNLLGKKFKIKGTFEILRDGPFTALNEKHYFYYSTTISEYVDAGGSKLDIYFADSDTKNYPPEQLEPELTCIVYSCEYHYYYNTASIRGYSYDLRN